MIKQNFYTLILAFVSQIYFTQSFISYYNLANEAEHQVQIGDYHKAKSILISLRKKYNNLKPKEHFYLGIINYFYKDSMEGFKSIESSIKNFLISKETREFYFGKFPYKMISEYSAKKLDSLEKIALARIDSARHTPVNDSLMYYLDFYSSDTPFQHFYDTAIYYKTQIEFLSFLKRRGIPNTLLYGTVYFLVFTNIDKRLYPEYEAFLFKQLELGNLCPTCYAILVDTRIYFESHGSSTKYGSFPPDNYKNPDEEIIKHRKEIGLGTCDYSFLCNCNRPRKEAKGSQ